MKRLMFVLMIVYFMFISVPLFADSHPPYIQENDVISAGVFNEWFATFAKGLGEITPDELIGDWNFIAVFRPWPIPETERPPAPLYWTNPSLINVNNLYYKFIGAISFKDDGDSTYSFITSAPEPFEYQADSVSSEGDFVIINNLFVMSSSPLTYNITYINKTRYLFNSTSSGGSVSSSIMITKVNSPPDTPSFLTVSMDGSDVVLSWTDNSTEENKAIGFYIYGKDNLEDDFVQIDEVDNIIESYTDESPTKGKHWYRVSSFNENGESLFKSNVELIEVP